MKECIECGCPIEDTQEYMCKKCIDYERWIDEHDDDDDWEYRKSEELYERACNCSCGAWQNINGITVHVADCCCGAE